MKNTPSIILLFHKAVEGVKYLFLALLAIVFLVELGLSLHWRMISDNAFLHYVAYLINEHGFVPYRDIFEPNMPGTYLFHMAVGRMFGYSDFAFQMVNVAWLTATLTVTWFIMKPVGRMVASASCLLFGLIYLGYGPYMSLQRDVIAILPIATALLLSTRRRPNYSVNLIHFLLGVFFALAALIKPHLAIGLPAMIVYNCIRGTKGSKSVKTLIKPCIAGGIFALVGFLSTLAIPFLWLWQIGALQAFWDIFSSYTPLYLQMSGDFQFRETFHRVTYALWLYIKFGGFSILLTTSMFGVYLVLTESMSAAIKRRAILLFSLVVLYSMSAAIGGKFWPYHWMPYIYFASLCTAMVLFSPPSFESLRRLIIIPIFVFITAMLTVRPPPFDVLQLDVLQLFYEQQPPPPMGGRVDEIATYLNEHLSPTDKVQPLDWVSGATHAMLISKAVVATPYITDFQFYHHVSNDYINNLRIDFIEKLKKEMPTVIIDVNPTLKPKMLGLDTTYQFPELTAFIKQNYKKYHAGNGFDIFRRNDAPRVTTCNVVDGYAKNIFAKKIAASSETINNPATYAFNGLVTGNDFWEALGHYPITLEWSYRGPHKIELYGLSAGDLEAMRMPSAWHLEGSQDKKTWKELDRQKSLVDWKINEYRIFHLNHTEAFQFYRLTFFNGGHANILRIYEVIACVKPFSNK